MARRPFTEKMSEDSGGRESKGESTDPETTIRQLDATTVERIAAGEIVERPASVVKELVENSLDADASKIDVTVENGGKDGVRIADDGVGMSEADVRAAVEKHTTSKIRDIDDLEAGVATLGFRGEALHTIGAVSRTTITTKPRGGNADAGTALRLEGGTVESVEPAGCPVGTAIEVNDLFYNTPARKKYLKADATEFAHVNTIVTQYALANPDVAVSLTHNDREVFATTGRGDLQSALLSVYGRDVATSMIAVESGDEAGETLRNVTGYVSEPETNRSTRDYVSTYINGRYVTSSTVRDAVLAAYGNQLAPDRYPFAVLFLDVAPEAVDVNVHPRKMEIRFNDEDAVRERVEERVEAALLDHGLVRSSAPRGRSAPAEADVSPERDEQVDLDALGMSEETPDEERTTDFDPGETANESSEFRDTASTETTPVKNRRSVGARRPAAGSGQTDEGSSDAATSDESSESASVQDAPTERKFDAPTESTTLDSGVRSTDRTEFDRLPRMRVLGQLQDTYIVAETPDGMVLVDQHAADERINYERLCEQLAADSSAQMLASPVLLELTAREAALFDEYRDALASLGFYAAREDGNADDGRTVVVKTVPAVFDDALDPKLLRDALSEFVTSEPDDGSGTVESAADELLSDLACYPSITGNTSLSDGSVVDLLAELDDCENPYACPHGRPVIIEFGEREIEDRFERDYPGHAGRRTDG